MISQLCSLLEADIGRNTTLQDVQDADLQYNDAPASSLSSAQTARGRRLVTYELFFVEYWPHFPQSLTKGMGMVMLQLIICDS